MELSIAKQPKVAREWSDPASQLALVSLAAAGSATAASKPLVHAWKALRAGQVNAEFTNPAAVSSLSPMHVLSHSGCKYAML